MSSEIVFFKSGLGSSANHVSVSKTDGTVRLVGNATSFEDLQVDIMAVRNGNALPTLTKWKDNTSNNSVGVWLYYFPHESIKNVYFVVQLPHKWKAESTIYPHVHWLAPGKSGESGEKVLWGLEYLWISIGDVASTDTVEISGNTATLDETIVRNKHYITELGGGISGSGKTVSSVLVCTLQRLGNSNDDTFTGDAALLGFDFHIEVDSFGSDTVYTKS